MERRVWMVGLVAAALMVVPNAAVGAGSDLTWKGYRGVHPGESLTAAAGQLGATVVNECGAHAVSSGPVLLQDRASGADGKASSITTSSKRVVGPDGVHVGMTSSAVARTLGPQARSMIVAGHRVTLIKGPHRRALWTVASGRSRRAKVTMVGLSPSKTLARRAAALTVSGCPTPPLPPLPPTPPVPPPCPVPLPAVGPYEAVICPAATGVPAYSCPDADWLDANGDPTDGCEREAEGLVPMTFGSTGSCSDNEAALSLGDRVTQGGYALGDFYACACHTADSCDSPTTGLWQEPGYDGTRTTPAVPHCSTDTSVDPSFDCPAGTSTDPAPLVGLDFNVRTGDSARVAVTPQDVDSDHLTIRARVHTQAPIAFDTAGSSCQMSVDSTAGSVPDLKLELDLVRGVDPSGPPVVHNVALTQLESSDLQFTGTFACQLVAFDQIKAGATAYLTDVLHEWADGFLTQWCGAPDPYWWQSCPTP